VINRFSPLENPGRPKYQGNIMPIFGQTRNKLYPLESFLFRDKTPQPISLGPEDSFEL
jgi:hypothetical protein